LGSKGSCELKKRGGGKILGKNHLEKKGGSVGTRKKRQGKKRGERKKGTKIVGRQTSRLFGQGGKSFPKRGKVIGFTYAVRGKGSPEGELSCYQGRKKKKGDAKRGYRPLASGTISRKKKSNIATVKGGGKKEKKRERALAMVWGKGTSLGVV